MEKPSEYNKIEQNQAVGRYFATSTVIVLILVAMVVSPVWNHTEKRKNQTAIKKAESIGFQIAEDRASQSRSLASIGHIALDPWGNPYQYKVSETDGAIRVDVWSTHSESIRTFVEIPKNFVKKED